MNTPWRVSRLGSRVSVLGIDGRVMTEILPGQQRGQFVTLAERLAIAELICDCVNGLAPKDDEWEKSRKRNEA